jgi:hypothetical protein
MTSMFSATVSELNNALFGDASHAHLDPIEALRYE